MKIDLKYADVVEAQRLRDIKNQTNSTFKEMSKMYDDTEKALSDIISLQDQLNKITDQKNSPYWNEINRQLEQAKSNYKELVASWENNPAYRDAAREASITSKYNDMENKYARSSAQKATDAEIKAANELYKEESNLLKQILQLQKDINEHSAKGQNTHALSNELGKVQGRLAEIRAQIDSMPDYVRNDKLEQSNKEIQDTIDKQVS